MNGPGIAAVEVREGDLDMLTYITQTPIDDEITEITIHFSMTALDDEAATDAIAELNDQVTNEQFTQDVPIWENKIYRDRPPLTWSTDRSPSTAAGSASSTRAGPQPTTHRPRSRTPKPTETLARHGERPHPRVTDDVRCGGQMRWSSSICSGRRAQEDLMGSLDEAVALEATGTGRWQAYADPDHESINGMFGGWTSAVSLAAVMASADEALRPSALTVNYLAAVAPGPTPIVHVEHLGEVARSTTGGQTFAPPIPATCRRPRRSCSPLGGPPRTTTSGRCPMPPSPRPWRSSTLPGPRASRRTSATCRVDEDAYGCGDTRTLAWIAHGVGSAARPPATRLPGRPVRASLLLLGCRRTTVGHPHDVGLLPCHRRGTRRRGERLHPQRGHRNPRARTPRRASRPACGAAPGPSWPRPNSSPGTADRLRQASWGRDAGWAPATGPRRHASPQPPKERNALVVFTRRIELAW